VVPASFSPKPEDFPVQVSAELRSKQSKWAYGYTLGKIEYLENQLRTAHFKREIYRPDDGYADTQAEALLREDIKTAKTAQTVMLDKISEWAGAFSEQHFKETVLPQVWQQYVRNIKGEPAPEIAEEPVADATDEALAPEDLEPAPDAPVLPSARHDDLASQPKSEVVPPDEISMGDVMAKLEEKSKD
jgi:hypothetical protein